MKIVYVHHGNRLKGNPSSQNDDMTELGYKDCKLVAELLSGDLYKPRIKAIYTSNYFRCTKTAEIIKKRLNVKILEDDRLNEFWSKGNETWIEVQNRITDCLNDIIEKYNDDDMIVCVTSGVNIGAFI